MSNINEKLLAEFDGIMAATKVTPKQILDAAKILYKEHKESKGANLPPVRCTSGFRQQTERCAFKVDKTITEYIFDAVEESNKRLDIGGDY